MEQLTIFDIINNKQIEDIGILAELEELKKQYLIDNHYKKITFGRTAESFLSSLGQKTNNERIDLSKYVTGTKVKKFPEYINKVYEILAKHYDVVESKIGGFDVIGIEKQENCIRIYQPRMQYSIWCISMLDSEFYKYAK